MTAPIYQRALGDDFGKLMPELQEYFSLAEGSGFYGIGQGVFDVVGCRQAWLRPLLALTGSEEAFFPEYGEGIPFRIENHAHVDPFGRPALTARREIRFPSGTRLFHDTTSAVPATAGSNGHHGADSRLVDHVGRYRRMVTDLDVSVTSVGHLRGVSKASRLFLGPLRIPLPAALDARAYAEQWWDSTEGKHRIQVKVIQPQIGVVLVYAGRFDYRLAPYLPGTAPGTSLPRYAEPDRWEERI
ncbi:DUF4166 domain-containing protein [Paenarthrobacter ilicis]|uniref:DUF4166 domain-containing protein n=1 Tax=Paenarthrobacter ilicis TaxID=43665 RepID=A0ABX0TES2_9MICC|nr:DUF4166 domain-containing protein [Paenarthrobacter ilicis]MBM7793778.1 hypothetical protein [Paenarthrobacter ilicis]NII99957.1 hypothetical protein [Paenarthrobacter ilicis]